MTNDSTRDDGRQGFAARLADVRHDLRTSVVHITGYSEMLLEDYEDDLPESIRESLQSLNDTGQRMLGMIDELLGSGKASLAELDLLECRERLAAEADRKGVGLFVPAPDLCTDNGAMIASVAVDKIEQGIRGDPLTGDVEPGLRLGG